MIKCGILTNWRGEMGASQDNERKQVDKGNLHSVEPSEEGG